MIPVADPSTPFSLRAPAPVVWGADSVVIREGTIFSYGWCARPRARVVASWIDVAYSDASTERVMVQYGNDRPDVLQHFPAVSLNCGYFVFFAFRQGLGLGAANIAFEFDDGQTVKYALPMRAALSEDPTGANFWDRAVAVFRDGRRAFSMMTRGQSGAVVEAFHRRKTLLGARRGGSAALGAAIRSLRADSVLLIDHALGGGANKFSGKLVERHLADGRDVMVWTFMPSLLRFQVTFYRALDGQGAKFHVTWDAHIQILASKKVSQLVFNNAVSFTKPHRVPELLVACKNICDAKITVYIHDFNAVCPSQFLIDHEGKFCGVPSIDTCRKCLPKINDGFVSLHVSRDIDHWRSLWEGALARADDIVCFSQSSVGLLKRAFAQLPDAKIRIEPHQVDAPPGQYLRRQKPGLRIGVVGHITAHKGSAVVSGLVRATKDTGVAIDVIVVGTLMGAVRGASCEQTGAYEISQLASLLTQHGVDIALLPSICAETFSYVTHELMALNVPVMCFDLGAQSEAVSKYALGRVVPLMGGERLAQELLKFQADLFDASSVQAPASSPSG